MKGGEDMDEDFNISKQELLESLADGYDLRRNAAEYIISWTSLSKSPTDSLSLSLKGTAESILKADEEEEFDAGSASFVEKPPKEGEGLLLGTKPTKSDLTNHHWKDGLSGATDVKHSHAVWPTYKAGVGATYNDHHFPYHKNNHPLRRMNTSSGRANFVEALRAHSLGGHGYEEKEMEEAFHSHLLKNDSPVLHGLKNPNSTSKTKVLGSLKLNGVNDSHQIDLYNRDFQRWFAQNQELLVKFQKEGRPKSEIENRMRRQHFEERADDWESSDYSEEDKNGEKHPHGLGLNGFMYGLEWFTPEERTAVMEQMHDEKGLDGRDTITLPNGDKISSARIAHNNLLRRTPEMNYMLRKGSAKGRNEHYQLESNDDDFKGGAARFNQRAVGTLAHSPITDGQLPMSSTILDAMHLKHGVEEEDEGGTKALQYLPRLGLHKAKTKMKKNYSYSDLKMGESKHFKNGAEKSIAQTRLPIEDLLFLAGHDPKTREPMFDHPIYG